MAQGTNVDRATLKQWIQHFRGNANLPFSTNSASITLEQLEQYIAEAKEKYKGKLNAFRIYPIRYPLGEEELKHPGIEREPGQNLTRPSLVLVPVKGYEPDGSAGEDYELDNPGDLYVLAFSSPQSSSPGDSTRLCPPKC